MVVGEDLWQLIAHEGLEGHLGVPLGLAPDGIEHNGAIARHCALNIGQPEAGEGRELLEWIGLGLGLGLLSPTLRGICSDDIYDREIGSKNQCLGFYFLISITVRFHTTVP